MTIFIKRVCEVGFEISNKLQNTPLATKTIATIGADNLEPFFSKVPNNFLIFIKNLNLPFSFAGIIKEFVNKPLILRKIINEVNNPIMKNIILSFFFKYKH